MLFQDIPVFLNLLFKNDISLTRWVLRDGCACWVLSCSVPYRSFPVRQGPVPSKAPFWHMAHSETDRTFLSDNPPPCFPHCLARSKTHSTLFKHLTNSFTENSSLEAARLRGPRTPACSCPAPIVASRASAWVAGRGIGSQPLFHAVKRARSSCPCHAGVRIHQSCHPVLDQGSSV